jgi:hypothetical protein
MKRQEPGDRLILDAASKKSGRVPELQENEGEGERVKKNWGWNVKPIQIDTNLCNLLKIF